MRGCVVFTLFARKLFFDGLLRFLFCLFFLLPFPPATKQKKHNKSLLVVISPDHTFISLLRRKFISFSLPYNLWPCFNSRFCNVKFVSLLIAFRRPPSFVAAIKKCALVLFRICDRFCGAKLLWNWIKIAGNARKLDAFETLGDLNNLHKRKFIFWLWINWWISGLEFSTTFLYSNMIWAFLETTNQTCLTNRKKSTHIN